LTASATSCYFFSTMTEPSAIQCIAAWVALGMAAALAAQSTPQTAFDVVSVKVSKPSVPANTNVPLGPGDAFAPTGGYFSANNFPLISYIAFAYKLMGTQARDLQEQSPAWIGTDRFDIQARVEGSPGKDQMRVMMRSLLADRFKLVIHLETRQLPVAALVVAKEGQLGPQIQPHPADSPCPLDAPPAAIVPDGRFPVLCGGLLQVPPSVAGRLRFGGRNVTIAFIATSLSGGTSSGRTMVDRTGLEGKFDFNLEWSLEVPVRPGAETPVDQPPQGPTFEVALREQLGLKLESQKGPVPVWAIDHVERPTGN
jgi:uncharacterized protein (TIGR03435 family)